MRIPVDLDRSLAQPLASQLAAQLRQVIRHGHVASGTRLPSSRELAAQLGIARNTVVRAYDELSIEGLVESRAASGFFAVGEHVLGKARSPSCDAATKPSTQKVYDSRLPLPVPLPALTHIDVDRRLRYDFAPNRSRPELFPAKAWRRLIQGYLSYGAALGMGDYGDPSGLYALRTAIATHLAVSRGLGAEPAQVLVTGGVQEGLNLIARLFLGPGKTAVVEDPCYRGASAAFESSGATLEGVRVDEDGLVAEALPNARRTILYLTPAHQYPTGTTLSVKRRHLTIDWAREHGAYLVEDDCTCEFQYDGSPLQAVAGMAPDCTLYLGTFSTTLGAGLGIGFLVVPAHLVDAFRAAQSLFTNGRSWLTQAVLAEFIKSGSYAAHLARARAQYRESRDALLVTLRRHIGAVDVCGETAGLHVLWRLPAGVPAASRLMELARQQHVAVYSMTAANAHEFASASSSRSLVLGYASLSPKQIEQGISRLSDAIDDTLDDHPDFVREPLVDHPPPRRGRPSLASSRRPPPHRQPPAIRTVARPRASDQPAPKDVRPMRLVRAIYRYPIKGLSPQSLPGVSLQAGKPFPFDRVFALARPDVAVDVQSPRWAKKGLFLMLMLDEGLARVQTHLDVETRELTVFANPDAITSDSSLTVDRPKLLLRANLGTTDGRSSVERLFKTLATRLPSEPKLVHTPGGHFMDKPDNVISCINLATLRSLESEWGTSLHPLRFRANFYIEGARAWEEFDWVGSDIQLGDVLFRVDRRNGRCGATNVNPLTGERDLDIPGSLRKRFGHKDLGVYLIARTSGKVVVGDQVKVPNLPTCSPSTAPVTLPDSVIGSFICRGCYYVYVERNGCHGVPSGTPFAAIANDFTCPDCGTGKSNFRPYLAQI